VGFRAVEGLGGALFAPAGLSLLMTTFREGRDRNLALGLWGAASGSGAAVGVLLGGVLTSYLSWPWIFFINVPVGLAIVLLTPRYLSESSAMLRHRHFDVAGAATVTASLMVLVYALTRATQDGWTSATTIALLAGSALLALLFTVVERRAANPLLSVRVFRGNRLALATLITAIVASIAFSQFFLLTLYLQQVLHYSAAQSGVAFVAIALGVAVMSNVAQGLVNRLGPTRVLAAGLLLAAASQGLLIRLPVHGHYATDLLPSFILIGIGMGAAFVAVTIAALQGVSATDAGVASGLVNTSRQVGGAVGLAVASTIAATYSHGAGAAALTHGFRVTFGVLAAMAVVGALLSATALAPRRQQKAAEAPDTDFALDEAA
jgi:EmrB/QacA subfamily drug resistance transporter